MLVILLNCITLGMFQPCVDDKCGKNRCKVLQVSYGEFLWHLLSAQWSLFSLPECLRVNHAEGKKAKDAANFD